MRPRRRLRPNCRIAGYQLFAVRRSTPGGGAVFACEIIVAIELIAKATATIRGAIYQNLPTHLLQRSNRDKNSLEVNGRSLQSAATVCSECHKGDAELSSSTSAAL